MQAQGDCTNISKIPPPPHKIYYYFRMISNFQIYFKNSARKILLESQKEKKCANLFYNKNRKEISFLLVRYAHQKGFVESRDPLSVALAGHLKGCPARSTNQFSFQAKKLAFPIEITPKKRTNFVHFFIGPRAT